MKSMRQVLESWKKEGYTEDFNAMTKSSKGLFSFSPEDFQIDKWYRLDEFSDPEEQTILYAISSKKNPSVKGVFVNGYGVYSDSASNAIIERLQMNRNGALRTAKTA